MRIKNEWWDVVIGGILVLIIAFLLWCFSVFNNSYIVTTDQNVHVTDKYHKAEDCTTTSDGNGSTYESCDPEQFVVIFDNNKSIDLKQQTVWSQVRVNQLWH